MSLFLGKKVEEILYGSAKFNNIDVIYTLEEISQPPYSHYIHPVSYDFTNYFEKTPLLEALLTHLLAQGEMARYDIYDIVGCLESVLIRYKKDGDI